MESRVWGLCHSSVNVKIKMVHKIRLILLMGIRESQGKMRPYKEDLVTAGNCIKNEKVCFKNTVV